LREHLPLLTSDGVITTRNDSPDRNATPVHLNVMTGDLTQAFLRGAIGVTVRGALLRVTGANVGVRVGASFGVSIVTGEVFVGGAGVHSGVAVTAAITCVGVGAAGVSVIGIGLGVRGAGLGVVPGLTRRSPPPNM
jgi:hypothetical protein